MQANEWQPIETVPVLENNPILGAFYFSDGEFSIISRMTWRADERCWATWIDFIDDNPAIKPTHWMPLPEPPK